MQSIVIVIMTCSLTKMGEFFYLIPINTKDFFVDSHYPENSLYIKK